MEQSNSLSKNLKEFQRARGKTLTEFSEELGIAKSTVRSVMEGGNTTLYTLIHFANALHTDLDSLVFGRPATRRDDEPQDFLHVLLQALGWFATLSSEKQKRLQSLLIEILMLLEHD